MKFKAFAACLATLFMIPALTANAFVEVSKDYDYKRFDGKGLTLNVANWGEYMSVNSDESLDVNNEFETLTGIKVNYKTYSTNEELYAKLMSGGADYDVIIPSDYMISRMIKENMLQKLDFKNIPNFSLIDKKFLNPSYDPTNEYSAPYMWGIVCIIYNTKMVADKIDSWNALWDEKYKGNILMFNNPRDAFGIALIKNGFSLNTEDKSELQKAAEDLKEQKKIVQSYVMDEIFDKMEGGSAAIAPYYAGDAVTMMEENPDLSYCIPKEGTNKFVDAVCIPTAAQHKEAAEMYINFLNEPEIAYANCTYIGYSTPNTAAYELLDDEIKNNPLQYPDDEYLQNKTEAFKDLSDGTNEYTKQLWNEVKASSSNSWVLMLIFLILAVVLSIYINIRRAKKKKQDAF
jgi:spermidine/putrescine transport system substrate-binding protein